MMTTCFTSLAMSGSACSACARFVNGPTAIGTRIERFISGLAQFDIAETVVTVNPAERRRRCAMQRRRRAACHWHAGCKTRAQVERVDRGRFYGRVAEHARDAKQFNPGMQRLEHQRHGVVDTRVGVVDDSMRDHR
jgi:hypothetical protein